MALNFKTLTTRTITAIFFVAVLLACIWFSYLSFSVLFFVVSIWGLYEFYQLTEKLGAKPYKGIGIVSACMLYAYAIVSNSNIVVFFSTEFFFPLIIAITFSIFMYGLFDKKEKSIINIAYTILGIVYVVIPFVTLMSIACIDKGYTYTHLADQWHKDCAPYNFHYVLGIMLLIWASDSGAYIVGSLIGKHKLYERISPGKTWEGSIGATILTIGCSFIVAYWYNELALKHWIVIAVFVCLFGTLGDLIESMLKRQAGVKDSGKIMPGHGGILDRFDSLIFVSPFVYAYLKLVL